jgi:phosphoadenosine phosphosulfate reductase
MLNNTLKIHTSQILHQISGVKVDDVLRLLTNEFPQQVIFSTSFSEEDQVITHLILNNKIPVSIFTLDTGRLFPETYSTWTSTNEKYGVKIKAFYPDKNLLEDFIDEKGPNAFYESVANRKECCAIRKVEPLKRALAGNTVWVTGLRAEHSPERQNHEVIEWDETNRIIKYNPILHWTTGEVKEFISKNNVPYNILHDRGFVSIGCAPCTRAIKPGEDFRAGRWWWEDSNKKECGIHAPSPNGVF